MAIPSNPKVKDIILGIKALESGKVDKTSTVNQLYGTDDSGNQTTYNKNLFHTSDFIQVYNSSNTYLGNNTDTQITTLTNYLSNINNSSLTLNTDNNSIVIGANVSIVKITTVIQFYQRSTATRLSCSVKVNGSDVTHGGSYLGQMSDIANTTVGSSDRRIAVTNTFFCSVSQNDAITFMAKSTGNTGTTNGTKDYVSSGESHIIVEVVK